MGWFKGYLDSSGLNINYDLIMEGNPFLRTGDLVKMIADMLAKQEIKK